MQELTADEVLSAYLAEADDVAADRLLNILIVEHAAPLARKVAAGSFSRGFAEDVNDAVQDVLLDVSRRLVRIRGGEELVIRSFRAYVATAAQRAAGQILRRRNPERFRFLNRVCYSLRTRPNLSLWHDSQGRRVCGLKEFEGRNVSTGPPTLGAPRGASKMPLPDLLTAVLARARAPVLLREIVDFLAPIMAATGATEPFDERSVEGEANLAEDMDRRAWLAALWLEIADLPRNQRAALLLNLRDHGGDSALRLLPALGIAGIHEIAVTLEMDPVELATIWGRLPLGDLELAEILTLERQQVVNLRKAARDRLTRRMGIVRKPR